MQVHTTPPHPAHQRQQRAGEVVAVTLRTSNLPLSICCSFRRSILYKRLLHGQHAGPGWTRTLAP